MKYLYIIKFLIYSQYLIAQKKPVETQGGNVVFNAVDSTYTLYQYYQSDAILSIEFYENDGWTRFGQRTTFNPDGKIAYIITFDKNNLNGPFYEFYANGNIKRMGNLYNNFKSGIWSEFDSDGKARSVKKYILNLNDSSLKFDPELYKTLKSDSITVVFASMPIKTLYGIVDTLNFKDVFKVLIPSKYLQLK